MQNRRFSKKPASFTPSDRSLSKTTDPSQSDPGQSDPSQDRFIRGIIKRKVGQLVGRAGFTLQDRESLEQDLLARVIDSLSKFDPEVGHRNKFVTAVVERYVANILRDKSADKRDHCRIRSLNVRIDAGEEGPTELSELIGEAEQDARLGRRRRSEQELYELVSDMKALIEKLPADWRRLLELRNQMTMAERRRIYSTSFLRATCRCTMTGVNCQALSGSLRSVVTSSNPKKSRWTTAKWFSTAGL